MQYFNQNLEWAKFFIQANSLEHKVLIFEENGDFLQSFISNSQGFEEFLTFCNFEKEKENKEKIEFGNLETNLESSLKSKLELKTETKNNPKLGQNLIIIYEYPWELWQKMWYCPRLYLNLENKNNSEFGKTDKIENEIWNENIELKLTQILAKIQTESKKHKITFLKFELDLSCNLLELEIKKTQNQTKNQENLDDEKDEFLEIKTKILNLAKNDLKLEISTKKLQYLSTLILDLQNLELVQKVEKVEKVEKNKINLELNKSENQSENQSKNQSKNEDKFDSKTEIETKIQETQKMETLDKTEEKNEYSKLENYKNKTEITAQIQTEIPTNSQAKLDFLDKELQNNSEITTQKINEFWEQNDKKWTKLMDKRTRYGTRKSLDFWQIETSKTQNNFELFYNLCKETALRQNFAIHPKKYLKTLFDQDFTRIILLKNSENEVCCAWLGIRLGQSLVNLYGGNNEVSRSNYGQYFLHLVAILVARTENCQFYDLGGLDEEKGFNLFKQGYLGKQKNFIGAFDLIFAKLEYKATNLLVKIGKNLKEKFAKKPKP